MNTLPRALLDIVATATGNAPESLTAGGWTSMLVSVSSVTAVFAWCLWRVMRSK